MTEYEELQAFHKKVMKYVESLLDDMTFDEIYDTAFDGLCEWYENLPEFEELYKERFAHEKD